MMGRIRQCSEENFQTEFRRIVCDNVKWTEIAEDLVYWQTLLLTVLTLQNLLPEGLLVVTYQTLFAITTYLAVSLVQGRACNNC
jgi:hypothetical protein